MEAIWWMGKDRPLAEMPIEELVECAQNAAASACGCIGHHKAARNEERFMLFNAELVKRGEPELDLFKVASLGVFNGKGAY